MSDPIRRFIREIHRRSLWQVLGIYVVASWAVLQVVDTLGGAVGLEESLEPMALVLLIIGLPIVLATAFVQEGGPRREAGDVEVAAPPGGAAGLFTWRNAFGGGVLAFALLGFVGTGWILFRGGLRTSEAPTSIEQSVAVLPFVNMSGDPDNEYFSDGITEELLNALAQIPDLRVPGRTSSFAFRGQNLTIQQIADTLNVAHVLEGSVRTDGDRVLITAQLVDAQTDTHLWSATFERELTDIFAIQREIATAIADQLQVTLSGEEHTQVHPAAQEAYFRGRAYWNERTAEGHARARQQFQRAIDFDPEYDAPYGGMASSYALSFNLADQTLAQDFAGRALELNPRNAEAHTALAYSQMVRDFAWEEAEQGFKTAIEYQPSYATAHQWGAELYIALGRLEAALEWIRRARELDPFSPIILWNEVRLLYSAGRYDECLAGSDALGEEFPDFRRDAYREVCLVGAGRYVEVVDFLDAPDSVREEVLSGNVDELWSWHLPNTRGRRRLRILALLGRADEFFTLTDSIFEGGGFGINLTVFLADPLLESMREDPRWEVRVLGRVRLSESGGA